MGFSQAGGSVGAFSPIQPFEFVTFRPKIAPSKSSVLTAFNVVLLSAAETEHSLAIPVGRQAGIRAGQVFQFTAGGIITTGNFQGTLTLSAFYGSGLSGIPLGSSPAQAYPTGMTNAPWRIVGELAFISVSLLASSSKIWCTGELLSMRLSIPFGTKSPVTVDSKGPAGSTSGGIALMATFTADKLSASMSAQYAFMRTV
jgi:hypothetical protein